MSKGRLEAFTDAVIAIIMTILVLELQPLSDLSLKGLWDIRTQLLSYLFSFFILAVTWNNHHHMFQVTEKITGGILWANTNLLFWVSLFPFVTATVDKHWGSEFAELLYVSLYMLYSFSWMILRYCIVKSNPKIAGALGKKDTFTFGWSCLTFLITLMFPPFGLIGCFLVTLIWVIPYKNVENYFKEHERK
ncbi:TMEM175 family protein [Paucilactobacillus sp. N302-9]|jgi:uncharacterized membrane protein